MTNEELFHQKNIELFMPDGIEYFHDILFNIGYDYSNLKSSEARKNGLETIKKLFELELIEISYWGKYHDKFKNKNLSNKQTIDHINEVWFEGAVVQDFYSMPRLTYKGWYLKALEKEGLTHTTYWKTFVKEKIINLQKWIEENRPKT